MGKMLTGSIKLHKIEKTKIVTTNKYGEPFMDGAKYLNIVLWINDEPDQFGNNASIQVSQTKEERDQRIKPTYIGNLKEFKKDSGSMKAPSGETVEDDLPF